MASATRSRAFVALALLSLGAAQAKRQLRQLSLLGSPAASPDAYASYYDESYDSSDDCLSTFDLIQALNATGEATDTFLQAAAASGALDLLSDPGLTATLFVPTDAAFEAAAAALNMSLADLLESPALLAILLNHVVPASLLTSELQGEQALPTLLGQPLVFLPDSSSSSDDSDVGSLSSVEATGTILDSDNCGCESCPVAANVIDAVLLPEILSIQTSDNVTTVTLGDGAGQPLQKLTLQYGTLAPLAAPAAAPAAAPDSASAAPAAGPAMATGAAPAEAAFAAAPAAGPEVPLMPLGSGSLRPTPNSG